MEGRRSLSSPVSSLFKILRPQFLIAGLFLNLLGIALAVHLGTAIDWGKAALFQVLVSSAQLAGAVVNEYADVATDSINKNRTWFSGGSGVFAKGLLGRNTVIAMAVILTAVNIAAMMMFAFVYETGLLALVFMIVGLVLALGYSLRPFMLSYRGIGELTMAFMVSFLTPTTSFLVQHGSWDNTALSLSVPIVFQMLALMMVVEYPDYEADRTANKRNLVVRLGRDRAWRLGLVFLVIGAATALSGMLFGMTAPLSVLVAAILGAEAAVFWKLEKRVRTNPAYWWATAGTSGFYILVLASAAAILAGS